jgi:hypothetical protein
MNNSNITRPYLTRACGIRAVQLALLLLLTGCSSGLSGEYTDENGIMSYEFQTDGKVFMKMMGMQFAGEYEIDENKVIVKGPNGNLVFEREGDILKGPMGLQLKKKEG